MVFEIEIGIAIAISIFNEDRDRDRDLNFGDGGSCLANRLSTNRLPLQCAVVCLNVRFCDFFYYFPLLNSSNLEKMLPLALSVFVITKVRLPKVLSHVT